MISIDPISIAALGIIIYELTKINKKFEKTNAKIKYLQDQITEIKDLQDT